MDEMIIFLMEEYKQLLAAKETKEKWLEAPNHNYWNYTGPRFSKAELQRTRLMLQKLMLQKEREF